MPSAIGTSGASCITCFMVSECALYLSVCTLHRLPLSGHTACLLPGAVSL